MPSRPNLLLIHADQHRADCLGGAGHPFLQTPHLDRLAGEGVRFTHAFTPCPVCSPARASLMTGTWATIHGCLTNYGAEVSRPADSRLPTLTHLLAGAGYRVAHVGKLGGEVAGNPTDHGAETFVPLSGYGVWRASEGLSPRPCDAGYFGETDSFITPEQSSLAWQARHVIAQMEALAASGQPFFVRWDPSEPHLPNVVPEPFASLYPPDTIPPWPSFPDSLENKPHVQRRTRQRWGVDDWTWRDWQPIVARYLGEISLLDAQIGGVLAALDRLGLRDNTLVVTTCDHGDLCGGHGMMDKHYVMYDDVVRVPLILRWPGRLSAGVTCDAFVSHELDVARTLLLAAGVEAPTSFVGRDLIATVNGQSSDPPREDIFAQYHGAPQGLFSQRMVRDRRWKYVYNPASIDELYDLDADPGELRNRADDPACAPVLRRLQERMDAWMASAGDPLSSPLFSWRMTSPPAA